MYLATFSPRSALRVVAVVCYSLSLVFPTWAQEDEWERLHQKVVSLSSQGDYAQAILLAQQALHVADNGKDLTQSNVGTSLVNLADLYRTQGMYAQAEPLYKRLLAIQEKNFGLEHVNVAVSLYRLAELYAHQRQYALAEPLYKRSLIVSEKVLGVDNPIATGCRYGLVKLYINLGQPGKAGPLYEHVLLSLAKTNGPFDPAMVAFMLNLAPLDMTPSQLAQAEPVFRRWLASEEKEHGPDAPALLASLIKLAEIDRLQGHYEQAELLFKRALMIEEKHLIPGHPGIALILSKLAELYRAQGQHAMALTMARRATSIYRQRIVAGGTGDAAGHEAANNQSGFLTHLDLLSRNPGKEAADKITEEAFQVVQLAQTSGTASALAKMANRFASGNDALASLIKRKQDAADRLVKDEAQLLTAASKPPQQRNAADEQKRRDDMARGGQEITLVDDELSRLFPKYQELTRPEPVSVSQVQTLLKPGEAMLVYSLGRSGGFLWVVKSDGADFLPLSVDVRDVAEKVTTIRAEMTADDQHAVSLGVLHDLYRRLIAPAELHLAGVQHMMVVPAGPLQSLPFGILVAAPPPKIHTSTDYRQVDWLAKHYAVSVLPAVSSIQALRQFNKSASAPKPFAGFGDPMIGNGLDFLRGKPGRKNVSGLFRRPVFNGQSSASMPASVEIADIESIRDTPPLPETADELRAMAKALKADQNSIWLRERATETRVKNLDLSKYRTIAFATHGVMAGEINGVGEVGLILTPPQHGTVEDDGYLAASEIAKLKLNADWVVLSACNTAAADGTPGAEGLSGLAKAFFYAGARSLLVSHWSVDSAATVPLTTGMLKEYEANPGQGKAEANRKAMLALMNTPDHPEYAHPLFWAPFVVVGEGGTSLAAQSFQCRLPDRPDRTRQAIFQRYWRSAQSQRIPTLAVAGGCGSLRLGQAGT